MMRRCILSNGLFGMVSPEELENGASFSSYGTLMHIRLTNFVLVFLEILGSVVNRLVSPLSLPSFELPILTFPLRSAGLLADGRMHIDAWGTKVRICQKSLASFFTSGFIWNGLTGILRIFQAFRVLERGMKDGYHVARVEMLSDEPIAEMSAANVGNLVQTCKDRCRTLQEWQEGSLWDAVVCATGEPPSFGNVTALSWWMAAVTHFLVGGDEGAHGSLFLQSFAEWITRVDFP